MCWSIHSVNNLISDSMFWYCLFQTFDEVPKTVLGYNVPVMPDICPYMAGHKETCEDFLNGAEWWFVTSCTCLWK